MNADVLHRFHMNTLSSRSNINLLLVCQHQNITLNFNHPVKELIFTGLTNTGNGERNSFTGDILLKLNGHDRFSERSYTYFTQTQVWQHHTGYKWWPVRLAAQRARLR